MRARPALLAGLLVALAAARTLPVNRPEEINPALARLKSGDTLRFGPGFSSRGTIEITLPGVVLLGAGPGESSLSSGIEDAAVVVKAANVTIRGFTIAMAQEHGIHVSDGGSALIVDNLIRHNWHTGINVEGDGATATITGNTIIGNRKGGVRIGRDDPRTSVTRNLFYDQFGDGCVVIAGDSGLTAVTENCFWECGSHVVGRADAMESNDFVDPLFCNPTKDWRLRPGSPCLPTATRGRIGAFGEGPEPPREFRECLITIRAAYPVTGDDILGELRADGIGSEASTVLPLADAGGSGILRYGTVSAALLERVRAAVEGLYDGEVELIADPALDPNTLVIDLP